MGYTRLLHYYANKPIIIIISTYWCVGPIRNTYSCNEAKHVKHDFSLFGIMP